MPSSALGARITTDFKIVHALSAVTLASDTDTDSSEVDGFGYATLVWFANTGTLAGTGTVALQAREASSSGGSYANISSATVAAALSATNGVKTHAIPINLRNTSRSRYHKLRCTTAGTTSSSPIAMNAIMLPDAITSIPITQSGVTVVTEV